MFILILINDKIIFILIEKKRDSRILVLFEHLTDPLEKQTCGSFSKHRIC